MRPPFPNGETITFVRRRPDGYDDFGVLQYRDETEVYHGAAVWSQTEREVEQGQERSHEAIRIVVTPGTNIDHIDAVIWQGRTYEMQGDPAWYGRSPLTGNPGPIVLNLTRVSG